MAFLIDRDSLEQILDLPDGVTLTGASMDRGVIRLEWQVDDIVPDNEFLRQTDVVPEYGVTEDGVISLLALHNSAAKHSEMA